MMSKEQIQELLKDTGGLQVRTAEDIHETNMFIENLSKLCRYNKKGICKAEKKVCEPFWCPMVEQ